MATETCKYLQEVLHPLFQKEPVATKIKHLVYSDTYFEEVCTIDYWKGSEKLTMPQGHSYNVFGLEVVEHYRRPIHLAQLWLYRTVFSAR